jgi:hypothetical protein
MTREIDNDGIHHHALLNHLYKKKLGRVASSSNGDICLSHFELFVSRRRVICSLDFIVWPLASKADSVYDYSDIS